MRRLRSIIPSKGYTTVTIRNEIAETTAERTEDVSDVQLRTAIRAESDLPDELSDADAEEVLSKATGYRSYENPAGESIRRWTDKCSGE